jgi:hypothetical protein
MFRKMEGSAPRYPDHSLYRGRFLRPRGHHGPRQDHCFGPRRSSKTEQRQPLRSRWLAGQRAGPEDHPGGHPVWWKDGILSACVTDADTAAIKILDRLKAAGVQVRSMHITEASLEDVFLKLTGRELRE